MFRLYFFEKFNWDDRVKDGHMSRIRYFGFYEGETLDEVRNKYIETMKIVVERGDLEPGLDGWYTYPVLSIVEVKNVIMDDADYKDFPEIVKIQKEYKEQLKQRNIIREEEFRLAKEEKERELYEELKKKYENE